MKRLGNLIRPFLSTQFMVFVGVGVSAALLNWLSGRIFALVAPFPIAVSLAYGVGMTAGFVLNRIFVFSQAVRPLRSQILWFFGTNLAFFPVVLGASLLLARALLPVLGTLSLSEVIGHGIALGLPVFLSFLIHKFITFDTVGPLPIENPGRSRH